MKFCFFLKNVPYFTGGLRYHGMAPLLSHVYELGFMEAISIPQIECFQGNFCKQKTKGFLRIEYIPLGAIEHRSIRTFTLLQVLYNLLGQKD